MPQCPFPPLAERRTHRREGRLAPPGAWQGRQAQGPCQTRPPRARKTRASTRVREPCWGLRLARPLLHQNASTQKVCFHAVSLEPVLVCANFTTASKPTRKVRGRGGGKSVFCRGAMDNWGWDILAIQCRYCECLAMPVSAIQRITRLRGPMTHRRVPFAVSVR